MTNRQSESSPAQRVAPRHPVPQAPASKDTAKRTKASAARPRISRTDIDGIPCFWTPMDGPLRAALYFRVGRADEELPFSGISHAVEHLALSTIGKRHFTYNGQVEFGFTLFYTTGEPDEIVAFLNETTTALADLPLGRLEAEKRVLQTEAASRKRWIGDPLFATRYGPRGIGLIGYEEYGLRTLHADQVAEWSATMFTSTNAAITLSGPPPKGLELVLGDSERWEWQPTAEVDQPLPALFREDSRLLACSFIAPRGPETIVLQSVLQERLRTKLREELGISYEIHVSGEPVDEDSVHVIVSLDSLRDHGDDAAMAAIDVVDGLAARGPTDAEFDLLIKRYEAGFRFPESRLALLDWAARDELLCRPIRSVTERVEQLKDVHHTTVTETLAESLETSLWVFPCDTTVPSWRFEPFQNWSSRRVHGPRLRTKQVLFPQQNNEAAQFAKERLAIGRDGITLERTREQFVTVLFETCAAVLAWDNGDRVLFGDDGFVLSIVPSRWIGGNRAMHAIDAGVPAERVIPMGEGPRRRWTGRAVS